jgi:hypothetical protein
MESKEVFLNLIILIIIVLSIIVANGCTGTVNLPGGDGFTYTPVKWGVFGEPGACKIDCEYEHPLFTTQTDYIGKLALASFGSYDGSRNIDVCSNAIIYYFSNINLAGDQTKAFLPFPGQNEQEMKNRDVPDGWIQSAEQINEIRSVDIREFFWRAGSLDATTGFVDQGEIPAYDGLKYNYMEVNYAGDLDVDDTIDTIELTYKFKSEFPCEGYSAVSLSCDPIHSSASMGCTNNNGDFSSYVQGEAECDTFLKPDTDCGQDLLDLDSNIAAILKDVCVGMMNLGLEEIREDYGFEQFLTPDCEIILPEEYQ